MGREIRMVPPNYQHPKDWRGQDASMRRETFAETFASWLADFDRIRRNELTQFEQKFYGDPDEATRLAKWLDDYRSPKLHDDILYTPWSKEEATWFQVWQTVSEGSPVSPPFATREELVDYLVKNGDFWDQKRHDPPPTRAQAEAFVNSGWAPSAVGVVNSDGTMTMMTGVAAASDPRD